MIFVPDYNQSMNSPEACRRRLFKYLIPVVVFSLVFNIPKFLEARIVWVPDPVRLDDGGGGNADTFLVADAVAGNDTLGSI